MGAHNKFHWGDRVSIDDGSYGTVITIYVSAESIPKYVYGILRDGSYEEEVLEEWRLQPIQTN
jgi:hypothetical protein